MYIYTNVVPKIALTLLYTYTYLCVSIHTGTLVWEISIRHWDTPRKIILRPSSLLRSHTIHRGIGMRYIVKFNPRMAHLQFLAAFSTSRQMRSRSSFHSTFHLIIQAPLPPSSRGTLDAETLQVISPLTLFSSNLILSREKSNFFPLKEFHDQHRDQKFTKF